MNKKLVLSVVLLIGANQALAGWYDTAASAFKTYIAAPVVQMMPEAWQGQACMLLGVCAIAGSIFTFNNVKKTAQARKQLLGQLAEELNDFPSAPTRDRVALWLFQHIGPFASIPAGIKEIHAQMSTIDSPFVQVDEEGLENRLKQEVDALSGNAIDHALLYFARRNRAGDFALEISPEIEQTFAYKVTKELYRYTLEKAVRRLARKK